MSLVSTVAPPQIRRPGGRGAVAVDVVGDAFVVVQVAPVPILLRSRSGRNSIRGNTL